MKINNSWPTRNLMALVVCVIATMIVYLIAGRAGVAVICGAANSLYAAWLGASWRPGHHDE